MLPMLSSTALHMLLQECGAVISQCSHGVGHGVVMV